VTVLTFALSGCSAFGSHKSSGKSESVYDVKVGDCFTAPGDVKTELASLNKVPCTEGHAQEAYAVIAYAKEGVTSASAYPCADVLTNFAQGSCSQAFQSYVGINYLDSSYFFTFLLPSARGWEEDTDRNVICFITTTGGTLTNSVKNTKK
jgi:hypothetical protein